VPLFLFEFEHIHLVWGEPCHAAPRTTFSISSIENGCHRGLERGQFARVEALQNILRQTSLVSHEPTLNGFYPIKG